MTIWSDALDDIYASEVATDGVLSVLTESVRVIDKTVGVDLMPLGQAKVPTIVPAACIRRSTLVEAGIALSTLINATITLNGVSWKIANHAYRARPDGELGGELLLILRQA